MARPRSFDKDAVLDQVMILFWEKGYGSTSMMDIQKATGLKPGSLYDSFGGKHELFLQAVGHYRTTVVRKRMAKLGLPGSPRKKLEGFFEDLINFSLNDGRKIGCLMSNSAVELAPHDEDARHIVQDNLAEIAQAFRGVVEEGIETGEFETNESAEDVAQFLTSTLQGIRVMAKGATSEEALRATAKLALKILD
jgi:TetR/AcrR family transcriptional repressor of nem operon